MRFDYEVYVLCHERRAALAAQFLDAFLPRRTPCAAEYGLPELTYPPLLAFPDASALIRHLEAHPTEGYAVYWNRLGDGDPSQAILVFTEDGGMIAGLVSARPDPSGLLSELAQLVGGTHGLVTLEERPPSTVAGFIELCEAR